MGTTSEIEVVPAKPSPGCLPAAATGAPRLSRGSQQSIQQPQVPRGAARCCSTMGGALCRPHAAVNAAIRGGNHGVSDPGARAGNGPARVRRGRSRHGCQCRCRCLRIAPSLFTKCGDLCRRCGAESERTSSGQSGPVRAGNPGPRTALVPHAMTRPLRHVRACARCSLRSARRVNNHGHVGCADHHAIDVRSVLGTVQGSSLRSARACARPSGLDGACAQIAFWQLRDGRR